MPESDFVDADAAMVELPTVRAIADAQRREIADLQISVQSWTASASVADSRADENLRRARMAEKRMLVALEGERQALDRAERVEGRTVLYVAIAAVAGAAVTVGLVYALRPAVQALP